VIVLLVVVVVVVAAVAVVLSVVVSALVVAVAAVLLLLLVVVGGRSVGIFRSRTKGHGVKLVVVVVVVIVIVEVVELKSFFSQFWLTFYLQHGKLKYGCDYEENGRGKEDRQKRRIEYKESSVKCIHFLQ
jgi:hypothetical protein